MKQILAVITIFLGLLFLIPAAFAQTSSLRSVSPTQKISLTPTVVPEDTGLLNQINNLKEKIASRVAQLKLVEKRGIIGTVTDSNNTQITLNDIQNNTRFIDVDEITKFSAIGKTSYGISDLTNGTKVSVLGLYNKDSRRILARFVDVVIPPTYLTGEISVIDRVNGQFKIISEDQKQTLIDVESITKTYSFTKATDLVKSGFSKLQTGNRVSIMGYPDSKTPSMIVANRIIQLLDVRVDPNINLNITPPTPTSGSSVNNNLQATP